MKNIIKLALICVLALQYEFAGAWGMTGHRVISEIAENHLSKTKTSVKLLETKN